MLVLCSLLLFVFFIEFVIFYGFLVFTVASCVFLCSMLLSIAPGVFWVVFLLVARMVVDSGWLARREFVLCTFCGSSLLEVLFRRCFTIRLCHYAAFCPLWMLPLKMQMLVALYGC